MDRRRFEYLLTYPIARRRFLGASLALPTAAISLRGRATFAAGGPRVLPRRTRPQFTADPFALGVASGDPLPDSVVLWTRLAPEPVAGGGMESPEAEVSWEIASDENFTSIVQSGSEIATADLAHSVHVDVRGLEAGSSYFYRFMAGDAVSPTGRTRTAPAAGETVDNVRFVASSCANYEHGFFTPYRYMAEEDVDFALCLGDYIYEYGPNSEFQNDANGAVRNVDGGETMTLADYRNRHALYKTDEDLRAAHQAMPWIVVWDDHEVENDYAGAFSENNDPEEAFLARRAAAYQAYYEHMPLRPESMPNGPDARLYRRLTFGDLVEIDVLDTRQYRTDQLCGGTGAVCPAMTDPSVTMTGPEQEAWLFDGLAASQARWNVIAQQVMMARIDVDPSPGGELLNLDQWDGYPLARQRLFDHLQAAEVSNPVVLTGDVHSSWVADLKLDFADPASPTIATEFVTTSVTSYNPYATQLKFVPAFNPHFSFYDAKHGYTRYDVSAQRMQTDYLGVSGVDTPDGTLETIASFVVEDGKPGAAKA